MNIIKYVFSKKYRVKFQNEYSAELAKKIDAEYNELDKIYRNILLEKYTKVS